MEPGELPAGARMDEPEARLGEMLERELGVAIAPEAEPTERPGEGGGAVRRARTVSLGTRRMRTVLGIAATVAVVAGASWVAFTGRAGRTPMLRGAAAPATGAWDARPSIEVSASAGARLSWRAAPGADSYAVVFLSSGLDELAAVRGIADTSLVLTPETRPPGLSPQLQGLWRVVAYHGGDEIGRSTTSPIAVP
jgi:hypothetical protein